MVTWKIYYGDGSTYSDDPFLAKATNVQVVAQSEGGKPILMHGKDAYYWRPDIGWQGCDMVGLWDYLMLYQGPKAVLFGRTLRDVEFYDILKCAIEKGVG